MATACAPDALSPEQAAQLSILGGLFGLGLAVQLALLIRRARRPFWNRPPCRLQDRPWTWQDVGLVMAALMVLGLALSLAGRTGEALGFRPDPRDPAVGLLHTLIMDGTAVAVILWLMRARGQTPALAFGLRREGWLSGLGQGAVAYLAIAPVRIVGAVLSGLALRILGVPLDAQEVLSALNRERPLWLRIGFSAVAVLFVPCAEEVLFRGLLLPAVAKLARPGLAVAFVSLLFAVLHGHPTGVVPLFIFAVGCSIAYARTGSLWIPIAIHALFNAVTLAAVFAGP